MSREEVNIPTAPYFTPERCQVDLDSDIDSRSQTLVPFGGEAGWMKSMRSIMLLRLEPGANP